MGIVAKREMKKSAYELKQESDLAYAKKKEREENLVQAYKDKKLKSKVLIKEARLILKKTEKENEK